MRGAALLAVAVADVAVRPVVPVGEEAAVAVDAVWGCWFCERPVAVPVRAVRCVVEDAAAEERLVLLPAPVPFPSSSALC